MSMRSFKPHDASPRLALLLFALLLSATLSVTPGVAQPPPAPAEPAEGDDRITFDVRLDDERGGGRVVGFAGDFEYQEDEYLIATGGVRLKYRDLQLQADTARIDIPQNILTAEGDVVLDEGPRRLVGDVLEYNLETQTGSVTNATAYVADQYYFTGDEIKKIDDDTYTLDQGTFTSCTTEKPPWELAMSHAKITLEDYARIKNARMKFGGVPTLWVPYMVWPTKTERSSGLLIPQPGISDRRGAELSMAYYQTLGRSADTTFFVDLSSEGFFGFGNEFRYRPSENTEGYFEGFILQDPDLDPDEIPVDLGFNSELLPDETRWKVNWFHESRDVWNGFRGVISFQDYSDVAYRQDFEREVRRQTNNFIYSQAYLTRNFGQQSFNIMVDQRERVRLVANEDERIRGGEITDTLRQLPEIEYRLRPTQLGSAPVYLSLDSNLHFLSREQQRGDRVNEDEYGRADLFPSLSFPLSTLPWLSFKVDVGGRVTHYTNTLDTTQGNAGFFKEDSESLTRTFTVAAAEIVGPSISKIYEKQGSGGRFEKFKHIFEPRFNYSFRDDFEEQDEVPLFDEIDNLRPTNGMTFGLINRILAKPRNEEEGGAFEIASFELSQNFSFDDDIFLQRGRNTEGMFEERTEGPIRAIVRYNPTQQTSLKAEARYNTLFGEMQSVSLSGGARFGAHALGGSLFTRWNNNEDSEITSNQVRLNAMIGLIPNKLTLDANVNYDIENSELLQQRYFINYQGSCYSLQFELRESQFGQLTDRDFRFSFTLRNVGTFIDLNGSVN